MFSWGKRQCAGFLIINVKRLDEIWCEIRPAILACGWDKGPKWMWLESDGKGGWKNGMCATRPQVIRLPPNDQDLLRLLQIHQPRLFSQLDDSWDMHWADGGKTCCQHNLLRHVETLGMLHFNGGGADDQPYFEKRKHDASDWILTSYYCKIALEVGPADGCCTNRRRGWASPCSHRHGLRGGRAVGEHPVNAQPAGPVPARTCTPGTARAGTAQILFPKSRRIHPTRAKFGQPLTTCTYFGENRALSI